ncbi:hypothetical protein D3C72_920910 [compost metagenome]
MAAGRRTPRTRARGCSRPALRRRTPHAAGPGPAPAALPRRPPGSTGGTPTASGSAPSPAHAAAAHGSPRWSVPRPWPPSPPGRHTTARRTAPIPRSRRRRSGTPSTRHWHRNGTSPGSPRTAGPRSGAAAACPWACRWSRRCRSRRPGSAGLLRYSGWHRCSRSGLRHPGPGCAGQPGSAGLHAGATGSAARQCHCRRTYS